MRSISRRALCLGAGGALALFAFGGTVKAAGSEPAVRPPGGQDARRIEAACIRCQLCYEACPRHVIAPIHIEEGVIGTRTPVMDYSSGWCDLCAGENGGIPICAEVCPTGALQALDKEEALSCVLGKASLDTGLCLAYRWTGCRFCYDACPYDAIELDDHGRPFVIEGRCNGCGACESVCASLQEGSISGGTERRAVVVVPEEGV